MHARPIMKCSPLRTKALIVILLILASKLLIILWIKWKKLIGSLEKAQGLLSLFGVTQISVLCLQLLTWRLLIEKVLIINRVFLAQKLILDCIKIKVYKWLKIWKKLDLVKLNFGNNQWIWFSNQEKIICKRLETKDFKLMPLLINILKKKLKSLERKWSLFLMIFVEKIQQIAIPFKLLSLLLLKNDFKVYV